MQKNLFYAWVALALLCGSSLLFAPEPHRSAFQVNTSTGSAFSVYASTAVPRGLLALKPATESFGLRDAPRKILIPGSAVAGNAKFVLVFNNPTASIVTQAKIYDMTGAEVADFREETPSGSDPTQLSWDGRDASGEIVRGGIYIYQVQAENKVTNGTVVVAR